MPALPKQITYRPYIFCLLISIVGSLSAFAQPKLEFNLKKPEQFKERKLGSEKMAEKHFTPVRRFFQNTYTHYNYYFNAHERLKTIVDKASESKQEDYAELLPFYRYTLEETAKDSYLDSVIQTATAGILLHDLRNDWIDNMYMLLGQAYLLKNHPDSASMTFQYINYSFAPKEKDGYDLPIGSNAGEENTNAFSISTKEKNSKAAYLLKEPPSRNEALTWQIRALTDMDNTLDASSMVNTLQNDPLYPERLIPLLHEHTAYMYYKLNAWDSAATHLAASLDNEPDRILRARRWYLAGQMFALAGQKQEASEAFAEAANIAIDPVMEVYARLNTIRLEKSENPAIIDENIAKLYQMAGKERYREYSDIILYAAALIELERDNLAEAENLLEESFASRGTTPGAKSRTAFALGNVRVAMKKYGQAANPYDSVNTVVLKPAEKKLLDERKPGTKKIFEAEKIIDLYDSLMYVAAMEEPARSELVKKVAKELRKARGLKEEKAGMATTTAAAQQTTDLFGASAGNWYFSDPALRAGGFEQFRMRFGDRPNVDNWRRSSAIKQSSSQGVSGQGGIIPPDVISGGMTPDNFDTTDISFDNLYSRLPVTPEKMAAAITRKINALYQKASSLHEDLEDYPEAIKVYNQILGLTDTGAVARKALFGLVHCYSQTGDMASANKAKAMLQEKFAGSKEADQLQRGGNQESLINAEATKAYGLVYDLFLQGKFDQAQAAKAEADKRFGTNKWSAQLLYIESVYYIRQRNDSTALQTLDRLVKAYPGTPMAERAALLKEYLPKRQEIEAYLATLEVTRAKDDEMLNRNVIATQREKPAVVTTSPTTIVKPVTVAPATDSTIKNVKAIVPEIKAPFTLHENEKQVVGIYLPNIDPTYVNEVHYSLNASSQKNFEGKPVKVTKLKIEDNLWLVLLEGDVLSNAEVAMRYVDYLRPLNTKTLIPWLDVNKYRYFIADAENLEKLKTEKKFDLYFQLLHQVYPFKF